MGTCITRALSVVASAVVALTLVTSAIRAEETGPAAAEQPSDWSVTLGALGVVGPEYEGSDEVEISGLPIVDISWRDRIFLNGRDGLGVKILNGPMLSLATSVGYTFGRDEDDSDDLRGLGDIDGGAVAIVQGAVGYAGFSFSTRASYQLTGEDTGFLVDFGPAYTFRSDDGWFLRPGLSASFASGDYMEEFFGVSAGQSARSGLAFFDADAGIKSVGAAVAGGYKITERWSLTGRLAYDRLIGDAADSPITRDEDQVSVGAGLSYSFGF